MKNQLMSGRPEWTIIRLLKWATSYFATHDIESPRASAEILLAHVLSIRRIDLYLRYDQPLCGEELRQFKFLLKRRINREPVAYIVRQKGFWSLDLVVTNDVLIPRPETECLVAAALEVLAAASTSSRMRILELGTGSGAVLVALASQHPEQLYFASDASFKAIQVARSNASRYCDAQAIHFFCGDWFAPLALESGFFDMVLSNPPYIKSGDMGSLQPEIVDFEPIQALDGGPDGLYSLRRIIDSAHRFLKPGGILMMEIAHDQKEDVSRIMQACGHYHQFDCKKDYGGNDRVVRMRKKMLRTDA